MEEKAVTAAERRLGKTGINEIVCKGKSQGKVHPRTGHEGPEGSRGIALLIL
jgi:hypothetical protein